MKCLNSIYILFITLISLTKLFYSLRIKQKDVENDDTVVKLSENYYNKLDDEKLNNFNNFLFKQIDGGISNNNQIKNRKQYQEYSGNLLGEYYSTKRELKFFISHEQGCSIFVNDTVNYTTINNVNFIEHMILHNNAESIDPKGVHSNDVTINYFAFNRKLNIFSVYFDPKKNPYSPVMNKNDTNNANEKNYVDSNFLIEFDYNAINLIKSIVVENKSENSTNDFNDNDSSKNYNSFIWKILNQNFIKHKENVVIELYFDLGKNFQHEDVSFSLKFEKSLIEENKKQIVKFRWEGVIEPQEVVILQAKFPMYFDSCGNISINLVMIFIGSIFIIFLIGMLYIILSTVFSGEP